MNYFVHASWLLLAGVLSAAGVTIQYNYDMAGRLVEARYDQLKTISYQYDAAGNLLERRVDTPATNYYTITTLTNGPGTIVPGNPQVMENADQTLVMTPAAGYRVEDVLVNGQSVGMVTSYTFYAVASNQTLAAYFGAEPVGCNYPLEPSSAIFGADGGTGTVTLMTGESCAWAITNANPWIAITSDSSGTGPTHIRYLVASNSAAESRTGLVYVATNRFQLSQSGTAPVQPGQVSCVLYPPGARTDGALWRMTTGVDTNWQASGAVVSNVAPGVTVVAFNSPAGWQAPANQSVTVISGQQTNLAATYTCQVTLAAPSAEYAYISATGQVSVIAGTECAWTAQVTSGDDWITLLGVGGGKVNFAITENAGLGTRMGTIAVEANVFTVRQRAQRDVNVVPYSFLLLMD